MCIWVINRYSHELSLYMNLTPFFKLPFLLLSYSKVLFNENFLRTKQFHFILLLLVVFFYFLQHLAPAEFQNCSVFYKTYRNSTESK